MARLAQGGEQLRGDGELWIDIWNDSDVRTGLRFVGDASEVGVTPSVTIVKTYDHTTGSRGLLSSSPNQAESVLDATLTQYSAENLALATMGDDATPYTQSGATITDQVLAVPKLDRLYQVSKRSISAVTVKGGVAGATVLTEGTDWVLHDALSGSIYFPSGSAFNPATDICKVTFTHAAITGSALPRVLAGVAPSRLATGLFIPKPKSGAKIECFFWKMQLTPNGPIPLITDEYGSFKMHADLLFDGVHAQLYDIYKRG